MSEPERPKIVVIEHGPYIVTGHVLLSVEIIRPNKEGGSWEYEHGKAFDLVDRYKLCRCGHSKNKPFCDSTHNTIGFDGTETASNAPFAQQAKAYDGPTLVLKDAESFCASARFCDNFGSAWTLVEQSDKKKSRELVVHEVVRCPSGRLVLRDKKNGKPIEEQLEPSIGVVEDPVKNRSGPLWVRGGIPIESASGKQYERRNRVTLCRCGASENKPFCDGSHLSAKFNDQLLENAAD
jgi:CDGSH-type Zn-finger protein